MTKTPMPRQPETFLVCMKAPAPRYANHLAAKQGEMPRIVDELHQHGMQSLSIKRFRIKPATALRRRNDRCHRHGMRVANGLGCTSAQAALLNCRCLVPEISDEFRHFMFSEGVFDTDFYLEQVTDSVKRDPEAALLHYVEVGEPSGLKPSGHFDPVYYLRRNPDLADLAAPSMHFFMHGQSEGRRGSLALELILEGLDRTAVQDGLIPEPSVGPLDPAYPNALARSLRRMDDDDTWFSGKSYAWQYPDVAEIPIDPLIHYLKFGRTEKRMTNLEFMKRISTNPELIRSDLPFILIGVHEGSKTGAPIVGFDLAVEMASNHNVVFVTLRDGPLVERAQKLFPVVIVASHAEGDNRFFVEHVLRKYPIENAIFSSSACVPFMRPLSIRNVRITCLVHEFLEYMLPFRCIIYICDVLIFSSKALLASWQHMLDDWSKRPEAILVLPQPPSSATGRGMMKAQARAAVEEATGLDLDGATLVLGAGQVQIRKGTDIFLQIGNQLGREEGKFVTVWIGEQVSEFDMAFGVWFHVQKERSRNAAGELAVHFEPVGPLYPILMDAADVFLVTSRLDPLPNVALDAADREMPVIAFRGATGLMDLAEQGLIDLVEVEMGAVDEVISAIRACTVGTSRKRDIGLRDVRVKG